MLTCYEWEFLLLCMKLLDNLISANLVGKNDQNYI